MSPQPTSLDITAIAALFVAVLALVATFWQAKIARNHNRKSTTPIITFHASAVDGYLVWLRNDGVGPAILVDCSYFVDNEQCRTMAEVGRLLRVPAGITFHHTGVVLPASVGVGQSVEFLQFSSQAPLLPAIFKLSARIDIRVTYKSVYGEQFAACLK